MVSLFLLGSGIFAGYAMRYSLKELGIIKPKTKINNQEQVKNLLGMVEGFIKEYESKDSKIQDVSTVENKDNKVIVLADYQEL